jgi:hypothetical protein
MQQRRPIPCAELRSFLQRLEYVKNPYPNGRVLLHPEEGLLAFRSYRADEPVLPRDLRRMRTFRDRRGVIAADDFDATLLRADMTPDETPITQDWLRDSYALRSARRGGGLSDQYSKNASGIHSSGS